MKKKRMLQCLMVMFALLSVSMSVKANQMELEQYTLIESSATDVNEIPDKYNTGCTDDLVFVQMDTEKGTMVNDVLFIAGSNGTRHVLDFCYRNKEIEGTIYINNYDFSGYSLWSYNEDKVERTIKVVFTNCKFAGVIVGKAEGKISFEFNNCTLTSFSGGNTVFNRCKFGGTYSDCLVPFRDVHVNDCFFSDMGSMAAADKEVHTDGTQIYGIAGIDVEDVSYSNCRFEIPPLSVEGSTAYINACIMFQLEYSNAKNVSFTDCIVNGGGYSIYARGKGEGFICDNVSFQNIRFGCSKRYGVFYTDIHPDIAIKEIQQTDALYVGSVWKENGETHLSVTNDTNQERILQVYTDAGEYTYTIPVCLTGGELVSEENLYQVSYADLPFDMDIVIPEDCQYVVCFDHTIEGCGTQIRYKNWTEEEVHLDNSIMEQMTGGENDILSEGQCGNDITYTLTKAGVLTLTGTGSTYNYHSSKLPEWTEYIDFIKEVCVEEGIEGLGSMIFRNCTSLKIVSLPDSLQTIGQRVFAGCVSLTELILPANIKSLGTAVCSGTVLQEIYYTGEDWNAIELGTGNENMDTKVVYYYNGQVYYRIDYILNDTTEEPAANNNPTTYLTGESFLFNNPVREGYSFEGWYAEEELITKLEGVEADASGNMKIYAKWSLSEQVQEPTTEQLTTEQPKTEQLTTDQPTTEQATTEQLTTEQATTEQATTERATTEQPTEGTPDGVQTEIAIEDGVTFDLGKFRYKIIGNGTSVELVKPLVKTNKTVLIPATVSYSGRVFKVTSIAKNAFKSNNKLTKVTLGKNITVIAKNAFAGCKNLKTVTIGKSVTTIGAKAFYNCKKLNKVTFKGTHLKKVSSKAFIGASKKLRIKVKNTKTATKYAKILKKKIPATAKLSK